MLLFQQDVKEECDHRYDKRCGAKMTIKIRLRIGKSKTEK